VAVFVELKLIGCPWLAQKAHSIHC